MSRRKEIHNTRMGKKIMRTIQSVKRKGNTAQCWDCKQFWPLENKYFYTNKKSSTGFRHQCVFCCRAYKNKRDERKRYASAA